MLGGLSRRHGAVRAALHTQNSALLSTEARVEE